MKKISLMLLTAAMAATVCSCAGTNGKKEKEVSDTKGLPEIHAIAYDESMDTLNDEGEQTHSITNWITQTAGTTNSPIITIWKAMRHCIFCLILRHISRQRNTPVPAPLP